MKLSMQISCFLLLAILGFSSAQEEGSSDFSIPIKKYLNGGKAITDPTHVYLKKTEGTLQVWFDPLPTGLESISVYFANDQKNIRAITYTPEEKTMIVTYYSKPWQYAGSNANIDVESPTEASPATIPADWLPEKITRVSASMLVNNEIFNYYGIKNYAISLPDTYVIENYMLADLTNLTPSQ